MNFCQMSRVLISLSVTALSLSALAGCSSGNKATSGNGDGGLGSGSSNGVTCTEILQCVSDQNCSTQDCIEGCIAKGSTDAQTVASALDACYQKNACQDSSCLQTKCGNELDACTAQRSSGGGSGTGGGGGGASVPPGSIPADAVGTWIAGNSGDLGSEQEFVFNADGTARYDLVDTYEGTGCMVTTDVRSTGTAVFDGTSFTFYEADSSTLQTRCDGTNATVPEGVETLKYTYEPQADGSIWVTDMKCAATYSDQASINLYCRSTYRKQ